MTHRLDKMAQRGLIQRRPDESNRTRTFISLTSEGWDLFSDAIRESNVVESDILRGLSTEESAARWPAFWSGSSSSSTASRPERVHLLVVGGSGFLGREIVQQSQAAGHATTAHHSARCAASRPGLAPGRHPRP